MNLEQLRKMLAEKSGKLKALRKTAKEANDGAGRLLTEEEVKSMRDLAAEIKQIEEQIELAIEADEIEARAANPSTDPVDDPEDPARRRAPAEVEKTLEQTQKTGLIAMSLAEAEFRKREDGEYTNPLKILQENGYDAFAKRVEAVRKQKRELMASMEKTLMGSVNISGGFLTPDNQATDIIELLRPVNVFMQGNPRIVRMPNGVYRQPGAASGATASYRQEGGRVQATEPTFREVNLSAKFLGALVLMTREMIDFSIPGVQNWVETDLRDAMAETMDSKAFYGSGSQGEPLGLFNQDGIQTVTSAAAATPTLAQIDTDFRNLKLAFLNNNIRNMNRWRLTMAPRTEEYLADQRVGDNDGEFAYPDIRAANPSMKRVPVLSSTEFPINGGAGADESDIGLINFADVLLGMMDEMGMATSSEATVYVNGEWISLFQNNLVGLRTLNGHDIGLRRGISVAKLVDGSGNGVTWGS